MRQLRELVWERQAGRCAVTGFPLDWERDDLHHRLAGGMGGSGRDRDRACNLLGVVSVAHNLGSPRLPVDGVPGRSIHTDPSWARGRGLLLSQSEPREPWAVPVRITGVGWVFLDDEGGWRRLAA
jgi:hypothetical protein